MSNPEKPAEAPQTETQPPGGGEDGIEAASQEAVDEIERRRSDGSGHAGTGDIG